MAKHQTRLVIYQSAETYSLIRIKNIPFTDQNNLPLDTTIKRISKDSIVIYLPRDIERLYQVRDNRSELNITIINDSPLIRVYADFFADTCKITGSPASLSLQKFHEKQEDIALKLRDLNDMILTKKQIPGNFAAVRSLQTQFNNQSKYYHEQIKVYADTVSSAAAFMDVYNLVDFGDDYKASKAFILKAIKRFPYSPPLQAFSKDVLATINIYEKEYNIGDKLPAITLPDTNGKMFSTSALSGQYYLIDFWSTLCGDCMLFKVAEKKVANRIPANTLKIISVNMDDQKTNWKKIIDDNGYNWIQLIDVKMWQGTAARTLVFDSIPFNFLVAPNGTVIKKAIKPDSLLKIISSIKIN